MAIRKLKNGGRKQAPFGTSSAAILAAAGINAATQMTVAGITSNATKQAARDQATAIQNNAQRNAQALKDQNEAALSAQQETRDFIKEENEQARELQKDTQLILQMAAGQQNVTDRLEASKIKVKNGGSTKRKLRTAGKTIFSLQGSNMPFTVTDGGNVLPVGQTPEGFSLYEIKGNDHEHYHKAQGGKYKSGVGIKFADGSVVEGEGNQNGNQGEYFLNTPDGAYFISRHSIAGFNPAKMVNGGMHPLKAYAIQEKIKAANGISDDGKHNTSPVKKAMHGGLFPDILAYNSTNTSNLNTDTITDAATGVLYNNKRKLRCGGRSKKAYGGLGLLDNWYNNYGNRSHYIHVNTNPTVNINPSTTSTGGFGNWMNNNSFWLGPTISGLGNIGGALWTTLANRSAAKTLANAYGNASDTLAEAYRNLKGIDLSDIDRSDYAAAHAMPALQAPISFANSQVAGLDRSLMRRLSNAGRYSASGAGTQDRAARAEIDTQDMRNRVYSDDQKQLQNIRQANAERVTQAAMFNAQQDNESIKQYTDAMLRAKEFNANVKNQSILGAAGALSEGMINSAGAYSTAQTANGQAWANALLNTGQGFANSFNALYTRNADIDKVLLGADSDSLAMYYANSNNISYRQAQQEYNNLVKQYNAATDDSTKNIIKRRINTIAAGRGFKYI